MILKNGSGLFDLVGQEVISKRNLFDLIQFSKFKSSSYWEEHPSGLVILLSRVLIGLVSFQRLWVSL